MHHTRRKHSSSAMLFSLLLLCGCRRTPSTPSPPSPPTVRSEPVPPRVDASVIDTSPVVAAPMQGPVACVPRGADVVLPPQRVNGLWIAAHGNEVLLTAHSLEHLAHEGMETPVGDDNEVSAAAWWTNTAAGDGGANVWRRDSLPSPATRGLEAELSMCETASYIDQYQVPAFGDDGWSRWTFAQAWGNAACTPCGGRQGRIGTTRLLQESDTEVVNDLRIATDGTFSMAAAILQSDTEGCSGTVKQVAVFRSSPRGLARTALIAPQEQEAVYTAEDEPAPTVEMPDVLAIAVDTHGAAIILRYQRNEFRLATVNREGRVQQRPVRIYRGASLGGATPVVGTPTAVFYRGELLVVWGERTRTNPRFRLRWMHFDPWTARTASNTPTAADLGPESPVQQLGAQLAVHGDLLALTWVEGGLRGAATVRLAVGRGLEVLATTGTAISEGLTTEARNPALALDGNRAWIAWQEPSAQRSAVRVRALQCGTP